MQKNVKLLFVVNPIAGGREKKDWETAIREFFKESDYTIEFYIQTGENDKPSIQHHIERFNPGTVVAIGGDGTVKMVAEIIKESPIKLGIIPAGSANGLARELGIPVDVNEAVKIIIEGYTRKLDAIRINEEELSFHLSDIGLNALLVKYFEASKKRGLWGYGQSLLKMLWNKRQMRVTISTDGKRVKRKAYMVVLANAEKYGTGAVINPDGNVSDGEFEVVVVRKLHVVEIIKAVMARKYFHPDRIEVFRTKNAKLQFQQSYPFQVDGEYRGKIASLQARIIPGIVNVLCPVPQPPEEGKPKAQGPA
ncbi:diacylglycerol/lipid kinase family protein [Flavisolibacter nicotianae]|uniref:diacylglycerol/lipid kinase family protein n=1 Tax=Flavisolibacter nicotianae TaxID=2364882 RepID=UPI000EAE8D92|nr:diacylglycerol kinase family protein [Flavisolibacter nicotianae]